MSKLTHKKLSLLDRVIGYFSPTALTNRLRSQMQRELLMRQYDSAQSFGHSPVRRNSNSANVEIKNALAPIRNGAREVVRNSPFAKKGVEVITNGIVGWGIEVSISHDDQVILETLKAEFAKWAHSGCSVDPFIDFYSMQKQVADALVTDGECILREVILEGSVRYHLLEADYIATNFSQKTTDGQKWVNGILMDQYFRPVQFAIFTKHPSEFISGKREVELVDASEIIHVYDPTRPQQNRGISWLSPVINTIQTLSELQWTQLVKMKLSASITAVVTTEPSQLPPEMLKKQREEQFAIEPGTVLYGNPGDKYEFPTVPNAEGFDGATKLALREIAAGIGVTYEALSNDLSGVNFSSGRMGALQFRANVNRWQWHIFIPRYLAKTIEGFKKYCKIKGIKVDGAKFDFVPPAPPMINPKEEIDSMKSAIRNGLQNLPDGLKELGLDPNAHLKKIADSNKELDRLGIVLDCDPRRIGNEQLQSGDSLTALKADQKNN